MVDRYSLIVFAGDVENAMHKTPDGGWMQYSEHERETKALRDLVRDMRAYINEDTYKEKYCGVELISRADKLLEDK